MPSTPTKRCKTCNALIWWGARECAPCYHNRQKASKGFILAGQKKSKTHRKNLSKRGMGDAIIKHHLYLREHDSKITLSMTNTIHRSLHWRMYDYVMERYGKSVVDNYIVWFRKKYGGV